MALSGFLHGVALDSLSKLVVAIPIIGKASFIQLDLSKCRFAA
jgi:hypothetical protein